VQPGRMCLDQIPKLGVTRVHIVSQKAPAPHVGAAGGGPEGQAVRRVMMNEKLWSPY
jgi:hypothetical protein